MANDKQVIVKPKILQVVLSLEFVGERVVVALAKSLLDQYDVMFCCLDKIGALGEELQKEGYSVVALHRKPGFDISLIDKIASLCRSNDITLIHAHHYSSFFYSALSRLRYGRARLLFTEHGRPVPDKVDLKRKFLNIFLAGLADKITAVSTVSKKGLCDNEWISRKKVDVIYNGITLEKENYYHEDRQKAKHVIDWIGNSNKVIGFLARLDPIKAPEVALKAFASVVKKTPGVRLVMVGKNDPNFGYRQLSVQLGIDDKVFFTGMLKNPYPVLEKCSVLIAPSLYEAASLAILEAMALGIPVVASRVGGNPELIDDSQTGYLIPSGDVEGFSRALSSLLKNEELRKRFGDAGQRKFKEKFLFSKMVSLYRDVYKDIIQN
jgi:glycosyltransferase involved in cell wall biosynthesis